MLGKMFCSLEYIKPSLLHVLILCYTKQNLYFFLISLFPYLLNAQ